MTRQELAEAQAALDLEWAKGTEGILATVLSLGVGLLVIGLTSLYMVLTQ